MSGRCPTTTKIRPSSSHCCRGVPFPIDPFVRIRYVPRMIQKRLVVVVVTLVTTTTGCSQNFRDKRTAIGLCAVAVAVVDRNDGSPLDTRVGAHTNRARRAHAFVIRSKDEIKGWRDKPRWTQHTMSMMDGRQQLSSQLADWLGLGRQQEDGDNNGAEDVMELLLSMASSSTEVRIALPLSHTLNTHPHAHNTRQ